MSEPDFSKIEESLLKQELLEKELYNWNDMKEFWQISRNAIKEFKSLYETMGPKEFMESASRAILKDSMCCQPYLLFKLLSDDKIQEEYQEAIFDFNRQFLSSYVKNSNENNHGHIIEFFLRSLDETISREFIDAIRLDPDSVLFTEKYIKTYGSSLKDYDWAKFEDNTQELINEAIVKAEESVLSGDMYNARKMYQNIVGLDENNVDAFFKLLLCEYLSYSTCKSILNKYLVFKDTKEYKFIEYIENECSGWLNFSENRNKKKTAVSNYIKDNNITNKIIINLLGKIEMK